MKAHDFAAMGMPVLAGRTELVAWLHSSGLTLPDGATALRELALMVTAEVTPEFEAYAHEILIGVDGEICATSSSEQLAETLLAVVEADVLDLGAALRVRALLVACGQPTASRPVREKAWQEFLPASPLVELHVEEEWAHNPVLQDPAGTAGLIGAWLQDHI